MSVHPRELAYAPKQDMRSGPEHTNPGEHTESKTASIGLADGGHDNGDIAHLERPVRKTNESERGAETIAANILKLEAKLSAGRDGHDILETLFEEIDSVDDSMDVALEEKQDAVFKGLELHRAVLQAQIDWLEAHLHLDTDTNNLH